jgi:hypothetical protein
MRWGCTIVFAVIAGIALFFGVALASSSPQQAAAAAMAAALAIIPYVIARAIDSLQPSPDDIDIRFIPKKDANYKPGDLVHVEAAAELDHYKAIGEYGEIGEVDRCDRGRVYQLAKLSPNACGTVNRFVFRTNVMTVRFKVPRG